MGTVDFNRLATIETNLVTAQLSQAQARASIALGLVQVYRALGGGWEIRLGQGAASGSPQPQPAPGPARRTSAAGTRFDSGWRAGEFRATPVAASAAPKAGLRQSAGMIHPAGTRCRA